MDFLLKTILILFVIRISDIPIKDNISKSISGNLDLHYLNLTTYRKLGTPVKIPKLTKSKLVVLALLVSGDINPNPGPSTHPCGFCNRAVTWENQRAICCDNCSIWYHSDCYGGSDISELQKSNVSWVCIKCDTPNLDSFSYHSYDLESVNRFSVLSHNSSLASSLDSSFSPKKCSSPISYPIVSPTSSNNSNLSSNESSKNEPILNLKKNHLRTLSINCQSLRNKLAPLKQCINYIKPDIITGCESWLDNSNSNAEVLPEGYNNQVIRRDRNKYGGGVFIATKDEIKLTEVKTSQNNCEIAWGEIKTTSGSVIIGSYYRPPDSNITQMQAMHDSVEEIMSKNINKTILLQGDFNLPHINWERKAHKVGSSQKELSEQLLETCSQFNLEQMITTPTRQMNILDLFLTNKPSLVTSCDTIPGLSDHDAICSDINIKPKYNKQPRREILLFNKANWEKIKTEIKTKCDNIIKEKLNVEGKWEAFKAAINEVLGDPDNITRKMSSKIKDIPWMNKNLKKQIAKRNAMFKKFKQTRNQEDCRKYKQLRKTTQKNLRKAHWEHINSTLDESLKSGNSKPFWKYVKAKRVDNVGVSGLKENGILHEDSKTKASLLLKQFSSVFTKEDNSVPLPHIENPTDYPNIENIKVNEKGVLTLLTKLNTNKASGPDGISNKFLKACASEISPLITQIFQDSLNSHELPEDWRKANVAPIFKKGEKSTPANYRPVSLTSVCCKLLEHIVCKHILIHLEKYNILSKLQHGFRSGHSCETQLLITIDDLLQNYNKKLQTDVIILDFSKAFDTVPHQRLLHKLRNYGINGTINKWIEEFLTKRSHRVIVDGEASSYDHVESGVPQGTVLGPLLFLIYINDLPSQVKSQVRLFADDCLLYRPINSLQDQLQIQKDLISLEKWASTWGMRFNATKCYVMQIARGNKRLSKFYELNGHILQQVSENPYLGLIIRDDLQWSSHIDKITSSADRTLGFIRRNLRHCNEKFKETAYVSLVRSLLEYSSAVWDPYLEGDIQRIEKIQRKAARFVKSDYQRTSSVTSMLENLGWQPLQQRRKINRLSMMYKIVNNQVAIPPTDHLEFNQRSQRNKHSWQIKIKTVEIENYKNSFFPKTIIDWNNLNNKQISCKSVQSFKAAITNI